MSRPAAARLTAAVRLVLALSLFAGAACGRPRCEADHDCSGGTRCVQSPANADCKPSGGWPCFSNSCYRVCPSFCAETCDGGCPATDASCVERLAIKDIGSNYDNVWTEPVSVCVTP